jgi:hypothetical protein
VKRPKSRWNLTSAQKQTRQQLEKGGLDVSISVLSFCATKDPCARHFLKVITIFKGMIEARELSNFEQRVDWAPGWTNLDPVESRPGLTSTSSEPASFGPFNNPAPTPSNYSPSFDLHMYSTASNISGPDFVHLANSSNQSLMPSTLPPGYFADPNLLLLHLNHPHPVSFDDSMDVSMDSNPGQTRVPPQHFQTFPHGFSQFQDFPMHEQSQVNAFSSA